MSAGPEAAPGRVDLPKQDEPGSRMPDAGKIAKDAAKTPPVEKSGSAGSPSSSSSSNNANNK